MCACACVRACVRACSVIYCFISWLRLLLGFLTCWRFVINANTNTIQIIQAQQWNSFLEKYQFRFIYPLSCTEVMFALARQTPHKASYWFAVVASGRVNKYGIPSWSESNSEQDGVRERYQGSHHATPPPPPTIAMCWRFFVVANVYEHTRYFLRYGRSSSAYVGRTAEETPGGLSASCLTRWRPGSAPPMVSCQVLSWSYFSIRGWFSNSSTVQRFSYLCTPRVFSEKSRTNNVANQRRLNTVSRK